jgi:methionyl aminopeptidase
MVLKGAEGAGSTLDKPYPIEFPKLNPGMAFTIEPMLNAGGWECEVLGDNWTVVTKDGSLSAQWEHTLLMTNDGVEVLTGS